MRRRPVWKVMLFQRLQEEYVTQQMPNIPCLLFPYVCRAAYGYVMIAGHLTSFGKLLGMAAMSGYFDPIAGASGEANNEAVHLLTGVPPEVRRLATAACGRTPWHASVALSHELQEERHKMAFIPICCHGPSNWCLLPFAAC